MARSRADGAGPCQCLGQGVSVVGLASPAISDPPLPRDGQAPTKSRARCSSAEKQGSGKRRNMQTIESSAQENDNQTTPVTGILRETGKSAEHVARVVSSPFK
ncbi:hypothetical protein IPC776_26090 [Pseudomonas aeruginosa]|nr:hypothetical protein AO902_29820 [Pseudomonas aeruginosa]RPV98402.1 hypothetical protein IPC776_26090 [Pseudomonas aeruginosa]RUA97903.1 hypothetical protein IPC1439_20680 [Pseudomonas aeruginosa]